MSGAPSSMLDRPCVRFPMAVAAVAMGLFVHLAMEQYLGLVVPLFLTFYPAIMLVAVMTGFWPGILATALSVLSAQYWLVTPRWSFGVESTSEVVALAFFAGMGVFMSLVAESHRRNILKVAAYEKERVLRDALLQSEKLAALGRMAATIAHEINNPLAAAMNSVFLAESSAERPESVREYLTLADGELRRISQITNQVLGFYRESTKPSCVLIGGLMDEVLEMFKSKIRAKQATIEKQFDRQLQITAVSGELRQVFANILANSLDAISECGTIKVRVSSSKGLDHGSFRIRITVADNGSGIEAAIIRRIFEPMFTTKENIGTGLGLWVCKQLIEKHNGSIWVRSSTKANRGTTFSIVLPLSPGPAARL